MSGECGDGCGLLLQVRMSETFHVWLCFHGGQESLVMVAAASPASVCVCVFTARYSGRNSGTNLSQMNKIARVAGVSDCMRSQDAMSYLLRLQNLAPKPVKTAASKQASRHRQPFLSHVRSCAPPKLESQTVPTSNRTTAFTPSVGMTGLLVRTLSLLKITNPFE